MIFIPANIIKVNIFILCYNYESRSSNKHYYNSIINNAGQKAAQVTFSTKTDEKIQIILNFINRVTPFYDKILVILSVT